MRWCSLFLCTKSWSEQLIAQLSTIHPKSGWICIEILFEMRGGHMGLHRGGMPEGEPKYLSICIGIEG